jgi:hypothetical protein
MSSIEFPTAGAPAHTATAVAQTVRRRFGLLRVLGGFVLTGFFLALGAATFGVAAVYGFIGWAQFY